jgi:cytochrome c
MPRFARSCTFGLIPLIAFSLASALGTSVKAANLAAHESGSSKETPQQLAPLPSSPEFYTAQVKPIFENTCGKCHLNGNHRGAFNMDTRASLLKGGHDGVVLVPGDPANSLLVKLIRHEGPADDPMSMPPHAPKLSDANIATITQWVKAGALMP